MFARWLMTVNVLVRFGVAFARLIAAGRRLRTSGRAATTNGRIWFLTIGALGFARAESAAFAAGRARAAGSRLVAVGPSSVANDWTRARVWTVCCSVPGRSAIARLMLVSWEAKARKTVELASTSETICPCLVF